ncbi:YkvA family protein [Rubrivivax sp. RP6-9]|uniref:YkvA family protein n=1 Tax=Rubrivivax sp. RP6-9 TaxID=3415750 RepID=UPI003CC55923
MKRLGRLFKAANAARLKVYLLALWKLFKHPETPRSVRWVVIAVLAYALSPIDLIPDFIPVLGLLDDLVLLPLGVALVVKLTPPALWQARLREAEAGAGQLPRLLWGAVLVVAVWLVLVGGLVWWMIRAMSGAPA